MSQHSKPDIPVGQNFEQVQNVGRGYRSDLYTKEGG